MKKTRYFLFPLLVALTFWIILRESSLTQIFDCLRTCSPSALAAAIGCMVVFVLCEAANPAALLAPDRTLNTNVRGNSVFLTAKGRAFVSASRRFLTR